MPTKVEKDAVTGTQTTGHEWDGIKELDTPLPKWWLYVFYACIAWSLVYYALYPAIPFVTGYTKGILGTSTRAELVTELTQARASQAHFYDAISGAALDQIRGDDALMNFAITGGRAAFADNCAPCHAPGGAGRVGYPTLADDHWLWGGSLDEIHETIRVGVRHDNDETRFSQMPAFGADGLLEADQVREVAAFVTAFVGEPSDPAAAERDAAVYGENCAACHGESGEGDRESGAPKLNDHIWLYGGSEDEIAAQVNRPRHGVMPAWQGRLDGSTIKMLTVYVHSLGGGE
jgi:cytochrome c oxidase cbb3-type subunit 3